MNAEIIRLVELRIQKSHRTFKEAELLYNAKYYDATINRLYYACYYAVSALLLKNNLRTKSHTGANQMLGLHFIKNKIISTEFGKFYSSLLDLRLMIDYTDEVQYSKDFLEEMMPVAKQFIEKIESLIK